MSNFCIYCGGALHDGDKFCQHCGRPVAPSGGSNNGGGSYGAGNNGAGNNGGYEAGNYDGNARSGGYGQGPQQEKPHAKEPHQGGGGNPFVNHLNEYVGNSQPVDLNWRDLFTDVFRRHTTVEAEDIFICGTRFTTPRLSQVSTTWPKPWLYSRVFLVFVLAFFLLKGCWDIFENANAMPGLIVIGAFTVPVTTLVLFFEVNAFRNISFYRVAETFLVGGCASLAATLFLYLFTSLEGVSYGDACVIGAVEEVGKGIIVYIFLRRMQGCRYILNGLLIGAAVGAGFAALESAGYAFNILLQAGSDDMMSNIYLRGLLTPGGHVAWSAITGAALMLGTGNRKLSSSVFGEIRFWKIFLIPVVLHAIWDMPIEIGQEVCLVQLLLLAAAWVVIFVMINMGLNQVKKLQWMSEP